MNKTLNRYGDTSFRTKEQVKLYFNILNFIYENNGCSSEEVYNWLKEENIINYSESKIKKRGELLIKQLNYFSLIEKNDKKISISFLGQNIINIYNLKNDIFLEKGINLLSVLFFYLLCKKGNLNKLFTSLVNFIYDNNFSKIDNDVLYNFICSPKDEYDNNSFSKYINEVKNELRYDVIRKF